jgi:hypothetical protein
MLASPAAPPNLSLPDADAALAQGNVRRALSLCLGRFGPPPRPVVSHAGAGWVGAVGDVPVLAAFDRGSGALTLEAPVGQLGNAGRAGALRVALELSGGEHLSHLVWREPLLVARFRARVPADAHELSQRMLDLAHHTRLARTAILPLGLSVDRGPLAPDALDLSLFGPAPSLDAEPPSSQDPWAPNPTARRTTALEGPPASATSSSLAPLSDNDLPPVLAPPRPAPPPPPSDDDLPPILAPPRPAPPPPPSDDDLPPILAPPRTQSTAELERVALPSHPSPLSQLPESRSATPDEHLHLLLERASELLAGTPRAMVPALLRALAYRAAHDARGELPTAIGLLLQGLAQAPLEPSHAHADEAERTVQQVLGQRASWSAPAPRAFVPLRSASEARALVQAYGALVDGTPASLHHHLLLGGLCELLVRAKLPPAIATRLSDIVSFGARTPSQPSAVELMRTALQRIATS